MKVSYHMSFKNNYSGFLNKYGGLPTHLPEAWPQIEGDALSFLFQIYCDQNRFAIPKTLCIQGYQLIEDGDFNSDIILVQVPHNATRNPGDIGTKANEFREGDICFEEVLECEEYDENINRKINIFKSKLQGWYPENDFPEDWTFLGWLNDEDPFYIGANNKLCMFLDSEGLIKTAYW